MALVGIARLASQSELLEAKRAVQYFEIPTRSILNRTKPNMPFQWTINPYRGCEFGCKYCYARYTHEFMELDGRRFRGQDLRQAGRGAPAAAGTGPHRAQGAHRHRHGHRPVPTGRAALRPHPRHPGGLRPRARPLPGHHHQERPGGARYRPVTRDRAAANVLGVNLTITTLDEKLARLLEPRAPRPALRLETVRRLSAAGICVSVFPNPIMPGITDGERSLDRLARAAREAGALSFGGGPLFLMPSAQKVFFPFLEEHFPELAPQYRASFARGAVPEQGLQGRPARARRAHPRALRAGLRDDRVPARTVDRRGAGRTLSATVKLDGPGGVRL